MYESPISFVTEQVANDIVMKNEGYLYQYIRDVGINIDKDELVKALQYDRGQYDKGYADGYTEGVKNYQKLYENIMGIQRPTGKWDGNSNNMDNRLSEKQNVVVIHYDSNTEIVHCPHCGCYLRSSVVMSGHYCYICGGKFGERIEKENV